MVRSWGRVKSVLLSSSRKRFFSAQSFIDFSKASTALQNRDPPDFGVRIIPNFITEEQEQEIVKECETALRKSKYENGHWDGVIRNYRELQRPTRLLREPFRRFYDEAIKLFPEHSGPPMNFVHILDLHKDGAIGAHVDSIKFGGEVVAGLSLLSTAIMRLCVPLEARGHKIDDDIKNKKNQTQALVNTEKAFEDPPTGEYISLLLPPRSFYVLSGEARYKWAHTVAGGSPEFMGKVYPRDRRISVILRDEVQPEHAQRAELFRP